MVDSQPLESGGFQAVANSSSIGKRLKHAIQPSLGFQILVTVVPFHEGHVRGRFATECAARSAVLRKTSMIPLTSAKSAAPVPFTVRDVSRIHYDTAGQNNGDIPRGSFAERAMSAAIHGPNSNGTKSR